MVSCIIVVSMPEFSYLNAESVSYVPERERERERERETLISIVSYVTDALAQYFHQKSFLFARYLK